jgi:hypothetical protein
LASLQPPDPKWISIPSCGIRLYIELSSLFPGSVWGVDFVALLRTAFKPATASTHITYQHTCARKRNLLVLCITLQNNLDVVEDKGFVTDQGREPWMISSWLCLWRPPIQHILAPVICLLPAIEAT